MFYTNVFQRGNNLCFRGFKDGKRIQERIPFKPTLFVRSGKETGYKTLFGENVDKITFGDINEARNYVKSYSEVSNFPIYGNTNYAYQFMTKVFSEEIKFDMSFIKILTIDIETSTEYGFPDPIYANEEVLLITVRDFNSKSIVSFGCKPFESEKPNSQYIQCKDEMDLFKRFIDLIKSDYPDVITGWNCNLFDIPYLSSRITKILGEDALKECSPWNVVTNREQTIGGRTQILWDWAGVSILDYLDLYKKFSYKVQESYKLDYIAEVELGRNKLKSPYNTFKEFYTKDWNLFVKYNIVDVELVDELEDKMKLIELILTMAYDAKCNYTDIFSPVRTWDCILHNALWKKNIIIHNPRPPEFDRPIIGAFVKEPTPGAYEWVVSFDATSLYPSIMMSLNMSPETLVNGAKYLPDVEESISRLIERDFDNTDVINEDVAMAANGQTFRKDKKGIVPELIEYYFTQRQIAKKQMLADEKKYQETGDKTYLKNVSSLNSKQMAAKILMNSLYGAMGNKYFRYYDIRLAEGITMTGQLVIRSVAKKLNSYLNEVCKTKDNEYSFYCDTDSAYITLGRLVDTFYKNKTKEETVAILDRICGEKIEPTINSAIEDLGAYINVFQNKLKFKREVIADRGVWIAKKRYALNVYNSEGVQYAEPKLKVMGLEIVRSSTPAPARKALKEAVNIVLTGNETTLREYVRTLESKWFAMSPEEIAFPRSVNNLKKYQDSATLFKKSTPMHVAGALIYNYLIADKGIDKQYQKIQEGDKIKFVYLKEPNTIGSHVITFLGDLPAELNLHQYVDHQTMFDKSFLEPLTTLTSSVGWKVKQEATLEGLFE